jgi:hypothetical protein
MFSKRRLGFKSWKFFGTPSLSQQKYMIAVQAMEAGIKLHPFDCNMLKHDILRRLKTEKYDPVLPKHWFSPQRIATKPRVRVRLHKVRLGTVLQTYEVEAYVYAAQGNFRKLRRRCKDNPSLLSRGFIRTWTVLSLLFFLSSIGAGHVYASEGGVYVGQQRPHFIVHPDKRGGIRPGIGAEPVHRVRTVHYNYQEAPQPVPHREFSASYPPTAEPAPPQPDVKPLATTVQAQGHTIEMLERQVTECVKEIPPRSSAVIGLLLIAFIAAVSGSIGFFAGNGRWAVWKATLASKVKSGV